MELELELNPDPEPDGIEIAHTDLAADPEMSDCGSATTSDCVCEDAELAAASLVTPAISVSVSPRWKAKTAYRSSLSNCE